MELTKGWSGTFSASLDVEVMDGFELIGIMSLPPTFVNLVCPLPTETENT